MLKSIKSILAIAFASALLMSGCAALSGCGKNDKKQPESVSIVESQSPTFFDISYDEPAG